VAVAVSVLAVPREVDVLHDVEIGMPVDPGVDNVGVDLRDGARTVSGLCRADVGIYAIDAPGQRLGGCVHPLIGLDVVNALLGEHLL
jgi:hypothetical protein